MAQTVPAVPAQEPDELKPKWPTAVDTALFPESGSAIVDLLTLTDGGETVQELDVGSVPEP
jgi:hypothetical protein